VLRLRNEAGELTDIKIDFWSGSDSVQGIVHELAAAEFIDRRDLIIVTANFQKLIDNKERRSVTFALNS
ncbi:hypothetical protein PMAYCL1PPCAC_27377, partial [Pristionchus mayeri]